MSTTRLIVIVAVLLCVAAPALAHRLDEYLQATTIFVDKCHVAGLIRLTPGVDVLPTLLPMIDTNGNGAISDAEQQAYARRVIGDLSLQIDGHRLPIKLISATFGAVDDMKEGLGEIDLRFAADLPLGGPTRALVFENRHQPKLAAYMVNCLAPNDPDVHVVAQKRNYDQSFYELDYVAAGIPPTSPTTVASWSGGQAFWAAAIFGVLFASFVFLRPRVRNRVETS